MNISWISLNCVSSLVFISLQEICLSVDIHIMLVLYCVHQMRTGDRNVYEDLCHSQQIKPLCVLNRFVLAPQLTGACGWVNSTTNSITFSWNAAYPTTNYLFDNSSTMSQTIATKNSLDAGNLYSCYVWAIGSGQLTSNILTCTNSTCEYMMVEY